MFIDGAIIAAATGKMQLIVVSNGGGESMAIYIYNHNCW